MNWNTINITATLTAEANKDLIISLVFNIAIDKNKYKKVDMINPTLGKAIE